MNGFGLVQRSEVNGANRFYYGISTSRYSEPFDQLDVILLLSKLYRAGYDSSLKVFVAGRFAQLNGRDRDELVTADVKKAEFLYAVSRALNSVPLDILTTTMVWEDPLYWQEVDKLKGWPDIIDSGRQGLLFADIYETFERRISEAIPGRLLQSLQNVEAPSLYRLFEVAEASYFRKYMQVDAKIGPVFEEQYDRYIRKFMDIVQLYQPIDLGSKAKKARPVTPYIGKTGENRIFVTDSKEELNEKIKRLANRANAQPMFYSRAGSDVAYLNPFVRLAVLAVEAAALDDSAPVMLGNSSMNEGADVIRLFEMAGTDKLMKYASTVSECLWAYVIRPIMREIREIQGVGLQ